MGMPVITSSNVSREQAITDVITSVALEQAALSHILNAEGEKIQKIVASVSSIEQILDANKSVKSMVNAVTRLEVLLQLKLEMFEDCLCEKKRHGKKCGKD